MTDKVEFALGDEVYWRLDNEIKGIVTGILFTSGGISYQVIWSDFDQRFHGAKEICADKTITQ